MSPRLGWYICGGLTGPPAWLVLWIVFDLDTPISLLLVLCLLVLLFAVSVVGCLLGYSSCLVVWIPLFLDPSAGAFGRFDLAALCGCRTLNFCLFVCLFDQEHHRLHRLHSKQTSPSATQQRHNMQKFEVTGRHNIPFGRLLQQLHYYQSKHWRPLLCGTSMYTAWYVHCLHISPAKPQ